MSPLKRREELQTLSEDHHNALVIALRCRRLGEGTFDAEPSDFWASVREFVSLQVLPHFEVEENLLIPALRTLGEEQMADRLLAEHQQLRAMITDEVPSAAEFSAFGRLLDDHIRYEERIVFESTQDRLPTDVLAEIRRVSLEVPQICPTTFRPLPR